MDRILWEIRSGAQFDVVSSMLAGADGGIIAEGRSKRLFVAHQSQAHKKLKECLTQHKDYNVSFLHQVTGKDVLNYPYLYMFPRTRTVRSFVAKWLPPKCPGGKYVGAHDFEYEGTCCVDYQKLKGLSVCRVTPEAGADVLLVSSAAKSQFDKLKLTGLTFSPCEDSRKESDKPLWFVAQVTQSKSMMVNETPAKHLAFCDTCGKYFGANPELISKKPFAISYLDCTQVERIDFQVAGITKTERGVSGNVQTQWPVIMNHPGLSWLQAARANEPFLRQPEIPHLVVETKPVPLW